MPQDMAPAAREWAKRILADPNIAALRGDIIIKPNEVLWLKRDKLLHYDFVENAVSVLARLAERIEKEG